MVWCVTTGSLCRAAVTELEAGVKSISITENTSLLVTTLEGEEIRLLIEDGRGWTTEVSHESREQSRDLASLCRLSLLLLRLFFRELSHSKAPFESSFFLPCAVRQGMAYHDTAHSLMLNKSPLYTAWYPPSHPKSTATASRFLSQTHVFSLLGSTLLWRVSSSPS